MSVDVIKVFEKFQDFIREGRFKKGKVRLILDRCTTELERREAIIEGVWDTYIGNPPGLFLKDAEAYDRIEKAQRGYVVDGVTPKFLGKKERRNIQKKGTIFVCAQSILFIEI